MKLIAHRGNINGPNKSRENSLEYIDEAINLGYDVEIDIRHDSQEKKLYLGHDESQYEVSMAWLVDRKDKLWIHCKDLSSLKLFSDNQIEFNYFWHQTDDFTLTSNGYIWTYPGKPHTSNSVVVMPESSDGLKFYGNDNLVDSKDYFPFYAICSDYVGKIK